MDNLNKLLLGNEIKDEIRLSFYINRYLFVGNPEVYLRDDLLIIKKILERNKKKILNFFDYFEAIQFPNELSEIRTEKISGKEKIRPIFDIFKNSEDLLLIEVIHYRFIYDTYFEKIVNGYIVVCEDGMAYEYIDGQLYDYKKEIIVEVSTPILIYNFEKSVSIFKDLKEFKEIADNISRTDFLYKKDYFFALNLNTKCLLYSNEDIYISRISREKQDVREKKNRIMYYANCLCEETERLIAKKNSLDSLLQAIKEMRCEKSKGAKVQECYWNERQYYGTDLKFRYSLHDFISYGWGTCGDTALICNSLFNMAGIETFMITARGRNFGHAACIVPELDLYISNLCPMEIDRRVGEKGLIYLFSTFQIESIQYKELVFSGKDFFAFNRRLMSVLSYLEKVYNSDFSVYIDDYKKAFSFRFIKKFLNISIRDNNKPHYIINIKRESEKNGLKKLVVLLNNNDLTRVKNARMIFVSNGEKFSVEINNNMEMKPYSITEIEVENEEIVNACSLIYIESCDNIIEKIGEEELKTLLR